MEGIDKFVFIFESERYYNPLIYWNQTIKYELFVKIDELINSNYLNKVSLQVAEMSVKLANLKEQPKIGPIFMNIWQQSEFNGFIESTAEQRLFEHKFNQKLHKTGQIL